MNLADDLDLDGFDEPTAAAIDRLGYTVKPCPHTGKTRLGEGTFADVFYAEHRTGRPAAIKVFKPLPAADEYFDNETAALEKPNFPKHFALCSYGSFREPGARPFIVLEYVRGTPIDQYAKSRTPEQRVGLLEQAARGLHELHRAGQTHRDIKADNLLVTDGGLVRYLDFGLAGTTDDRNQTIAALGNLACTAPEVAFGRKRADERDDIYSLAALGIQVLTGDLMPENKTKAGDPHHLRRCRQQLRCQRIDRFLEQTLLACLADWNQRTVQADSLADRLEDWRVRRPLRRKTGWLAGVSLLLLTLLLGGFAWYAAEQRQQFLRRDVSLLRDEVQRSPNAQHPTVAKLVAEAATTDDPAVACELLRQARRIADALHSSRQRREALGVALNDTAWTQLDAITQRRDQLGQLYQRALGELERGEVDAAGKTLDELQLGLAELSKDNVAAGAVAVAKQQFDRVDKLVPERLRVSQPRELAKFTTRAHDGLAAAKERKWNEATDHLGQARKLLVDWLRKEMTPEELEALRKANVDQIKQLEEDLQRLNTALANAEQQRKVADEKRKEYEERISGIVSRAEDDRTARSKAEDQIATLKGQLKSETACHKAVQAEVQQKAAEIARLQQQKSAAETKLAAAPPLADRVPQLQSELNAVLAELANERGRSAQLASVAQQFRTAADKAISDVEAAKATREKAVQQQLASERTPRLEVVFVIDTTSSMAPLIEMTNAVTKRVAADIADREHELKELVKFGLVQYRDSSPGLGFVKRLETPLTDIATFQQRLKTLSVATILTQEEEEDVIAGLVEAIENGGWSRTSAKHIILIGDASALVPPSKKSTTGLHIKDVITMATRKSIVIHAVRGIQEHSVVDDQFSEMSKNGGFYAEVKAASSSDIARVTNELAQLLKNGIQGLAALRVGVRARDPAAP